MNGDDGAKAGFPVGEEGNLFMTIKIRGVENIHDRNTPTEERRQKIRAVVRARALARPYTAEAAMGLPIWLSVSNGGTEAPQAGQLFITALQSHGARRLITGEDAPCPRSPS
jgi:aminopeptidase N